MKNIVAFDPSANISGKITIEIANPCGRIRLFNDSQIALLLTFADGSKAPLPPWFFRTFILRKPGNIEWTQLFTLSSSSPPVSKVYGESYERNEAEKLILSEGPLSRQLNVGNPVPVGTEVSNLSNEGNAVGTQVIDIGPSGNANMWDVKNDNFTISVVQSGVAHQVIKGQSSGNPLIIGKLSDIVQFLGNVIIDNGKIGKSSAGDILDGSGGQTILKSTGGTNTVGLSATNGVSLTNGTKIGSSDAGSGNLIDWTSTDCFFKAPNGKFLFESPSGTFRWSIQAISTFTGTGTGTYNHGLGFTPDFVIVMTNVSGSQTVGYDSLTSTQVHVTCGAGLSFKAMAIKF